MADRRGNTLPAQAADVARIERISSVPTILQIVCETTGLGFAAVARVTQTSWTACAVMDRIGFGLQAGAQLEVTTTFCNEIQDHRQPIVIDKASEDPSYIGHQTPLLYGFESYIAVPIIRRNGEVFGTICALDPKPAPLREAGLLPSMNLFAELIAAQLDLEERLETSQLALTDAREMDVLRDQFIAILGHDLRNPIASITSGLRRLSKTALPSQAMTYVAHMRQSCARMAELVDNMLDFARGRLGGGIPAERRAVEDLGAALQQIVEECRGAHAGRRIEADIALAGLVFCDPQRIAQVLSNLLSNALHHGAPDKPVQVLARSEGGGLLLRVTNQGLPIPAEKLAQLFQPFSRGDNDSMAQGLGLGLYIAFEIAEAHAGTLQVTSTAEATIFTLELPAAEAPAVGQEPLTPP
jgi:signal transduction histidine kinase